MKIFWAILINIILISGSVGAANTKASCTKFPAPTQGGFCIHLPEANPSADIVYYLHGKGGNEFDWQDEWNYTAQIRTEWKKQNAKIPTVVSISFGEIWLLAEKNESPYSGIFESFTTQIMPMIEQKLGGLKGRRIVFGESMGGFNSVQLSLKTPMFDKAGIICAPMAGISPFASQEVVTEFIEKSGAWQYYKDDEPEEVLDAVAEGIELIQAFYPTQEKWDKGDPLKLAQTPMRITTKMYVAIGFYDRYAAFEGNEVFVDLLKKNKLDVEWRPQWGEHCSIDIPSIARFLTE